jgi:putative membrane protein
MIKRFIDHSANERTYLSWIGTSIAIMAFGFVIERFDIFISYIGKALGSNVHVNSTFSANLVGILLLFIAVAMVIVATIRFYLYKKAIDADKPLPYGTVKSIFLLAALMVFLGIFLAIYMFLQIT